jgi:hypothetical protein
MIPFHKLSSYFNCRQAFIRSLILSLGLVFVLSSSFVPRNQALNDIEIRSGWLTPSSSAMEKLCVYQDTGDPNADLHLSVRKQTKVKCAKKLSPVAPASERLSDPDNPSAHSIAGFDSVKRPAYYIFLFRYTLF